jgi:hypothetical protein
MSRSVSAKSLGTRERTHARQQKFFLFEAEPEAERASTRIPHEPREACRAVWAISMSDPFG